MADKIDKVAEKGRIGARLTSVFRRNDHGVIVRTQDLVFRISPAAGNKLALVLAKAKKEVGEFPPGEGWQELDDLIWALDALLSGPPGRRPKTVETINPQEDML